MGEPQPGDRHRRATDAPYSAGLWPGPGSIKRGGKFRKIYLQEVSLVSKDRTADVLAVDEALTRLAALDPQHARVVELRFFGGLNVEETAEVLGVSPATVKRNWNVAKAWLARELKTR